MQIYIVVYVYIILLASLQGGKKEAEMNVWLIGLAWAVQ